ncbi:cupin domain-containing protein [Acidocella sp.]|uniref:cupin domain-containing protein n=1 Tax=Acidocella sp. TaxID=50710 RepID=UPI002603C038|nr:cupin domain-containing protein [Acidocella sp.]
MSRLSLLPRPGIAEWEDVAADRLVSGSPKTRTFVLYENAARRLAAGEWEASPGKWRISYTEWEYIEMLSGACVIEVDDGRRIEAGPGDRFVIEPGFTGTWEVLSPMRKAWVIQE